MLEKPFVPAEAVEALVGMGMPRDIALFVKRTRGNSAWGYVLLVTLSIVLMVICMAGPAIFLARSPVGAWLVRLGVIPRDAFLVDEIIVSLCGMLFVGIFSGFVIFILITLVERGLAIRSAITGIQTSMMAGKNRALSRWMVGLAIRRIDSSLPCEQYLIAYQWASIRMLGTFVAPLFIATLLVFGWELSSISFATPDGVSASSMIGRRRFFTWDQIEGSSTGSSQGTKQSKQLCFQLHPKGSPTIDLARWEPTDGSRDNLASLARIDDELRKRNVPWSVAVYTSGIYQGTQQWDPQVFYSYRADMTPEEWETFKRVYRLE